MDSHDRLGRARSIEPTTPVQLRFIHKQGFKARKEGRELSENPYEVLIHGAQRYTSWRTGWYEARDANVAVTQRKPGAGPRTGTARFIGQPSTEYLEYEREIIRAEKGLPDDR